MWGEPVLSPERSLAPTGIYVVALTDRLDDLEGTRSTAPICEAAVNELRATRRDSLSLDGIPKPSCEAIAARLAAFWLADEVVLYIGLAGTSLAGRVAAYYRTPLGVWGPHAGGWPLKTLSCFDELYVHYAYCENVAIAEHAGVARFAEQVSSVSRARLHDPVSVMPFANLRIPRGRPKAHGIGGARAPR